MAHGALGTDTGGSCRIPAALCGLVGFKPTQARVPRDGVVPLAPSLDSVGVLGRTVACCAALTAMLRDQDPSELRSLAQPPRLGVPRNYLFDDLDSEVSAAFARAIRRLEGAGADLVDVELPVLDEIREMKSGGGIVAAEAFAWHRDLIAEHHAHYDPRVLSRIQRGDRLSARDLLALRAWREGIIDQGQLTLADFDAIVCPTVPVVAPPLDSFVDDEEYARVNLLMLRNPTVVNLLDGCAVSVPIHDIGEPPTGLMVAGLADRDDRILMIASWIEARVCSS